MASGTVRKAETSRVPCHSCQSTNGEGPGYSDSHPQLTTSGSRSGCTSGRAYRNALPFGAHSHLWHAPT